MTWVFDDGGRADAGFKGDAGDCVTRAIAIATRSSYRSVYDDLHTLLRVPRRRKAGRYNNSRSPREGVPIKVTRAYLAECGWEWVPVMGIGTGTTMHVRADELPAGRIIVRLSGHMAAVIDGVVHDTHDPSRDGTRAVYGYWRQP